jgi:hypothetical protein
MSASEQGPTLAQSSYSATTASSPVSGAINGLALQQRRESALERSVGMTYAEGCCTLDPVGGPSAIELSPPRSRLDAG